MIVDKHWWAYKLLVMWGHKALCGAGHNEYPNQAHLKCVEV